MRPGSEAAFAAAKRVIPGGVNSTVRAFKGVGGTPVFMREAHGAYLTDVDGREIPHPDQMALCRCGHSNNKPFCDGTHLTIDFDGTLNQ